MTRAKASSFASRSAIAGAGGEAPPSRPRKPQLTDARVAVVAIVVGACALAATSCHLLGLQADACEPGDAATCPAGTFCNAHAVCEHGSDPTTTPVDVATNEKGVALLVVDADGALLFATASTPGCVRTVKGVGAKAEDFACEPLDAISALGVDDARVYWTAEAGAQGALRTKAKSLAANDAASTLLGNVDAAPIKNGLQMLSTTKNPDGSTAVIFARTGTDFADATRISVSTAGTVPFKVDYTDSPPTFFSNPSATLVVPTGSPPAAFVGATVDGKAALGYRLLSDDDNGGGFGFEGNVDFTAVHAPAGDVTALVPLKPDASLVAIGTSSPDGSGVIIQIGTSTFDPQLLAAHADRDSPSTHASALATDGTSLFYATAGSPAPGKKRGLFKLALFTPDAKPERLVDLAVDGGSVAVDVKNARVVWAEPANNRIRSVALPHTSN